MGLREGRKGLISCAFGGAGVKTQGYVVGCTGEFRLFACYAWLGLFAVLFVSPWVGMGWRCSLSRFSLTLVSLARLLEYSPRLLALALRAAVVDFSGCVPPVLVLACGLFGRVVMLITPGFGQSLFPPGDLGLSFRLLSGGGKVRKDGRVGFFPVRRAAMVCGR